MPGRRRVVDRTLFLISRSIARGCQGPSSAIESAGYRVRQARRGVNRGTDVFTILAGDCGPAAIDIEASDLLGRRAQLATAVDRQPPRLPDLI
jgi:hypothetical protein